MTASVIDCYPSWVGRWEPGSRSRLEEAALSLFAECGFEETTVAAIAVRAGLTERTFFRYFADKREVLFAPNSPLQELLVIAVADAADGVAPLDVVAAALEAAAGMMEGNRAYSRRRHAVIAASPELHERELIKLASLAAALAGALRRRGVAEPVAGLAAEVGIAVFRVAFARWVEESGTNDLITLIRRSFVELRLITAATGRRAD